MSRYTVEKATFKENSTEQKLHVILDNGVPDILANQALLNKMRSGKNRLSNRAENTSSIYRWCKFSNYIWETKQKTYKEATMNDIYSFLCFLFNEKNFKYNNLISYISVLSQVYENLALRHYPIDKSLFRPTPAMVIRKSRNSKSQKLTYVSNLKALFFQQEDGGNIMPSYCKWYTPEQIAKISDALRLDYECIFLISIYTGFRISSILSLKLDSINLQESVITETSSKTGQIHSISIPENLRQKISTYINEMRSLYGSYSEYLFIGRNGLPITYNAYLKALQRTSKITGINEKLHTHAGRSTFLYNLRSFQLEQKRCGREVFTDEDICQLMDWKSMQCLNNYDKTNRIQELSPIIKEFQNEIYKKECGLNEKR